MRVFRQRTCVVAVVCVLAIGFLAATCLITSPGPVLAAGGQTGVVNGTVLDDAGKPLAGVTVVMKSPSGRYAVKTDGAGFFSILSVDVDTYALSIEVPGFVTLAQGGITIQGGNTLALGKVSLTRAVRTIGRTSVRSAASAFTPNQTVPQYTVSGTELETAQGKKMSADESAVLLAVPGFQKDASGNLILQGSTTDQVRYQIDGVDFSEPGFNLSGNGNFFNGIGSVQVVQGAGDPSQSNVGAGAVNLITRRGTYPGSGLLDVELDNRPETRQVGFQYGIARPDGRLSNFTSYLGRTQSFQYGPWGTTAFAAGAAYQPQNAQNTDFLDNLIYKFGAGNSQQLQLLYVDHASMTRGNLAGATLYYPSNSPDFLAQFQGITGLSVAQIQSIIPFEQGQRSATQALANNILSIGSSSLLKLEYDNTFDARTSLALRLYHSDSYTDNNPNGPTLMLGAPNAVTQGESSLGGSRTGMNFELNHQLGTRHLVTLSGSYQFNRPTFGSVTAYAGLFDLGPNAKDFLTPANPNLPVSASNPCPVAGGCYLQQFFYAQGGTPRIPAAMNQSNQIQHTYGIGLRDQFQVNSNLRLDAGLRYDRINEGFGKNLYPQDENVQPVPGAPTVAFIPNYQFVEAPHFLEPRFGASLRLGSHDSMSATYGRSIMLPGSGELGSAGSGITFARFANIPVNPNFTPSGNPFTGATPVGPNNCQPYLPFVVGAAANAQPSYSGAVGKNLQLGRTCANYADLLYSVNDGFYPDIVSVQPGIMDNLDLSYSHEFGNRSALKVAPFLRQGYKLIAVTAPLVFNSTSGTYGPGTTTSQSVGRSTAAGVDLQYTLATRPVGFNGFLSVSYVNEFTNTPPGSDNPFGQDFWPFIVPQSLAAGNLYRAGFVSPLTARLGVQYRTRTGFRINPVLNFNIGYPIGSGLLTPVISGAGAINVPNTNVTDQFGPGGAPAYVDPANPGSIFAPVIAATRGTKEKASGGGVLSRPQLTGNITFEYSSPKSPRATYGLQVLDLFNNQYFGVPVVNGNYYPVTTGVAAPLTGQSQTGLAFPTLAPLITTATNPYGPYLIPFATSNGFGTASGAYNAPTTVRVYFQYAL
jgi:outer membrane receptor protein involved in Fe transport